jgi:hypothetical protein
LSGDNTGNKATTKGKERAVAPEPHKYDMAKEMEEMEDDDAYDSSEGEITRKEGLRQVRAAGKKARKGQEPPAISYSSTPELHGAWSGVAIESVADYDRLHSAAMGGDADAVGYFSYLNAVYQRASLSRTPGISRVIHGWKSIHSFRGEDVKAYKRKLKTFRERHSQPDPHQGSSGSQPPTVRDNASSALSEGVVGGAEGDIDNYASSSPPQGSQPLPDTLVLDPMNSNPRDPPQTVGQDWASVPIRSWPKGMRVGDDPGGLPRRPTVEEQLDLTARWTPFLPDVQVIRYLTELSPFRRRRDHSTKIARQNWLFQFTNLFSIPGLYRHIVERSGFPAGNRRRERFPFITNNLGPVETAIWILDHGLSPLDPQVEDNERWAVALRSLNDARDTNGVWDSEPSHLASAQVIVAAQLANIGTEFQYPPRAPSAHARSWATSTELIVDDNRRRAGLLRLHNHVTEADEDNDADMRESEDAAASLPK